MRQLILPLALLSASALADYAAPHAPVAPHIDGQPDPVWDAAPWAPLDQLMVGSPAEAADFSGRYKVLWDAGRLYLLAEIIDDIAYDGHPDPRLQYWDDDCLEIFLDDDKSGGDHLTNFNAFAYHVGLDNQVVDIGPAKPDGSDNFILLNDHLQSRWRRSGQAPHAMLWELAIKVFDHRFDLAKDNQPVTLQAGKQLGFMLAYCDADDGNGRQHFYGSQAIKAVNGDKNLGYKDASVFGTLLLLP